MPKHKDGDHSGPWTCYYLMFLYFGSYLQLPLFEISSLSSDSHKYENARRLFLFIMSRNQCAAARTNPNRTIPGDANENKLEEEKF